MVPLEPVQTFSLGAKLNRRFGLGIYLGFLPEIPSRARPRAMPELAFGHLKTFEAAIFCYEPSFNIIRH
jgi:hypothetical protein